MNIEFYQIIIIIIFYWRIFYFDYKIFFYSVLKSTSATVLIKTSVGLKKLFDTNLMSLHNYNMMFSFSHHSYLSYFRF